MFSKEIMKDEETHRRESLSEKSFQKSQITNKKINQGIRTEKYTNCKSMHN